MGTPGKQLKIYGVNWWEVLRWFAIGLATLKLIQLIATPYSPVFDSVLFFGTIIGLLIIAIYYELIPRRIVLYENGIGWRQGKQERSWTWDQITSMQGTRHTYSYNGIPVLRYGANRFYAGPDEAFSVSYMTAQPNRLVELILMKMAASKVPAAIEAYDQGRAQHLGDVWLDRESLRTAKDRVYWGDVRTIRLKGNWLWIERCSTKKGIRVASTESPSTYVLIGVIDHVLRTGILKRLEQQHIQGTKYWMGLSKDFIRMTVALAALAGVIVLGIVGYREFTKLQEGLARNELTSKYGNIFQLCVRNDGLGQAANTANKYVVIDMEHAWIHKPFQNALDQSEAATSGDDATVVICLRLIPTQVEQCPYGEKRSSTGDKQFTFYIDRYLRQFDATLVDVKTRKVIRSGRINGPMPGQCPEQAKISEPDIFGPEPGADAFMKWLKRPAPTSGPGNAM